MMVLVPSAERGARSLCEFITPNLNRKASRAVLARQSSTAGSEKGERSFLAELTLGGEKTGQDGGAALGQDTADDLGAMIQARIAGNLIQRMTGPRLGIGTTVNDERNARLDNGPGTHRTRFEGDIKNGPFEPPGLQRGGGLGDGDHLGVGGGILEQLALIVCLADDAALRIEEDSADGHLIFSGSQLRLIEGHLHVRDVQRMPRIGQRQVETKVLHAPLSESPLAVTISAFFLLLHAPVA